MVHYSDIDADAPFASAFVHVGMGWASYIVSFGAVTGEYPASIAITAILLLPSSS